MPKSRAVSENTFRDQDAMIAECAYYRAERRGFIPGYELDDWYEAEREVATLLHLTPRRPPRKSAPRKPAAKKTATSKSAATATAAKKLVSKIATGTTPKKLTAKKAVAGRSTGKTGGKSTARITS